MNENRLNAISEEMVDLNNNTDTCKTNLIIAFYFGGKKGDVKRNCSKDRVPVGDKEYVAKQLYCLNKFKHNLAQITFVIARDENDITDYSNLFPNIIKNTPVIILHRENNGLSYGSYQYAFQLYKNIFDYYIFIEDDYMFVLDNFDQILINGINSIVNCDLFLTFKSTTTHIDLGIVKSITLEQKNWLSSLTFNSNTDSNEAVWLNAFNNIKSFSDSTYLSPYYARKGILLFNTMDKNKDINEQLMLIVPNEMLTINGEIKFPTIIYKVTTRSDHLNIKSRIR
jgi:hypothetical protein